MRSRPRRSPTTPFIALGPVLGAVVLACGAGAWGPPVCTGGARAIGSNCFCPRGTTFDGQACQGTPEQGSCVAGAMEVSGDGQSLCYCPDGWVWADANKQSCAPCEGGSLAVGDTCQCPQGTEWNGNQCQEVVMAAPTCTGGAFMTEQGCMCPDGTAWDGANCVASGPTAPPPQQVIIRQQTNQSSSSFTCCINGAKYTCPNDAEFRNCMTLQGHGCAPAGGC
ncbi:MAG: hypothetical protein JNL21_34670 [Myxococcales bacterium]|nr:hypothetical protein [Myxococcales bacterium]